MSRVIYDQATGTDDGQPLVIEAAPRNLRQIGVPGEDDISVQISKCLTECQVVLVDEEPRRHNRLRRQRPQLLLVGDGGPYLLGRNLIAIGDLPDRLAGVEQFPQPLGGHPLHGRTAEADEGIDDDR